MSRHTPTRARVREIAELLVQKGIVPTSTIILSRLGKGSPNTVVDELRRWKAEREAEGRPLVELGNNVAQPPASQPSVVLDEAAAVAAVAALTHVLAQLTPIADTIKGSVGEMGRFATQLASIDTAVVRLDGIRLYALRQVDDARDKARYWEEEARRLRSEGVDKEHVYRQAMYAARSESDHLRGQVEALKSVIATLQVTPKPSTVGRQAVATLQASAFSATRREGVQVATLQPAPSEPAQVHRERLATLQPSLLGPRSNAEADDATGPRPAVATLQAPLRYRYDDPDGPTE